MIPTSDLTPRYIMQTFRRRFWYIILPFFVVSLTATLYCIKAPKAYRATTLILVEPQKVPSEYVRTTVTTDLQSRLKTISQQIKSRTRLEKTIRNFDLFSSIIATGTMTEAVEAMRRKIEIEVRSSRRGGS